MSKEDIIRAWKDPEYRDSLSEEQRSQLPENPAGIIDLPDKEMESVAGGIRLMFTRSIICGTQILPRPKPTKSRFCFA